jgi:hypothetical protein
VKNRFWRLRNHEKWGPAGDSETVRVRSGPRGGQGPRDLVEMMAFGLHFGRQFRLNSVFFDIDFYIKFQKAFLEDVHGFWTSFSWLLDSGIGAATKKANIWKTYVSFNKNLCFRRPRALFFGLKTMKNGVGTRDGIGGDIVVVFMDFRLHFELQNPGKTIKKRCRNRTRFRYGKEPRSEIPGGGEFGRGRRSGMSVFERFSTKQSSRAGGVQIFRNGAGNGP